MVIREFQENDIEAVKEISVLYWTDPDFLKELSGELKSFLDTNPKDSYFLVAEENNEVVGIAGFRKIPDYLKTYASTSTPVEFYVIAVKYKRRGIGGKLKSKIIEEAKKRNFGEILLYSPGTHDESWNFHDRMGFERVGEVTPPEDGIGHLWRKVL